MTVPFPNHGFMRSVYPGFLQLTGFMSMNLDRHLIAQKEFLQCTWCATTATRREAPRFL